jgi:hypothetical protein
VRDGVISEMSIGYQTIKSDFDPTGARRLKEIRLYEFGPVDMAANEKAVIAGVKSLADALNQGRKATDLDIAGINAAEFTLVTPKAATTLTQGQSTTFRVRFTPREGGPREAHVSILSSDALNNPFVVNLAGEGIKDPTITEQPEPLMLLVGQPAAFDAEATSDSVMLTDADFQWRRNNGAIKGALGTSFAIPAVTLKDAGAYSVQVKVGKTVALSNPAQLGVVQANAPALILAAGTGKAVNLTVLAAGNGLTYQWFKGATPLADTADV